MSHPPSHTLAARVSLCECGAKIIFADNERTGNPVPLDFSAQLYNVRLHPGGRMVATPLTKGVRMATLVTHFATCPLADKFSKGRKR